MPRAGGQCCALFSARLHWVGLQGPRSFCFTGASTSPILALAPWRPLPCSAQRVAWLYRLQSARADNEMVELPVEPYHYLRLARSRQRPACRFFSIVYVAAPGARRYCHTFCVFLCLTSPFFHFFLSGFFSLRPSSHLGVTIGAVVLSSFIAVFDREAATVSFMTSNCAGTGSAQNRRRHWRQRERARARARSDVSASRHDLGFTTPDRTHLEPLKDYQTFRPGQSLRDACCSREANRRQTAGAFNSFRLPSPPQPTRRRRVRLCWWRRRTTLAQCGSTPRSALAASSSLSLALI